MAEAASGPTKPLEHAAAVAAIYQRICVLPMRFGTVAAEESEVRSLLCARQGELLERLDYLDGAGEMALRVAVPRPSDGPAAPSSADPAPQAYFQRAPRITSRGTPRTSFAAPPSSGFWNACAGSTGTGAGCRTRRQICCG